jgi:hypothetical protein
MNSKGLAKLYDRLTPWERVPLIIAAGARGDQEEQERLKNAASTHLYEVPDYHRLSEALCQLANLQLIIQLDLALLYYQATGMLEVYLLLTGAANDERENRLCKMMQVLTYRYVAHADAWRQVRGRLQVDPEVLLRDYPGSDSLQLMEETARLVACSHEDATAIVRQGGDPDAQLATAAEIADAMWKFLEDRADCATRSRPSP